MSTSIQTNLLLKTPSAVTGGVFALLSFKNEKYNYTDNYADDTTYSHH